MIQLRIITLQRYRPLFPEQPGVFELSPQTLRARPAGVRAGLARPDDPSDRALRLRLAGAADRVVDEHRLDRRRVVQLAEDRLKLPEALGKRFDALGGEQRGEELDGVA